VDRVLASEGDIVMDLACDLRCKSNTYINFDPLESTEIYPNLGRKLVEIPSSFGKSYSRFQSCAPAASWQISEQKKATAWWLFDWSARQELNLKPGLRRTV
jgi:hypothetical protein